MHILRNASAGPAASRLGEPAPPLAHGATPPCGHVWSRSRRQRGVGSRRLLPAWSSFGGAVRPAGRRSARVRRLILGRKSQALSAHLVFDETVGGRTRWGAAAGSSPTVTIGPPWVDSDAALGSGVGEPCTLPPQRARPSHRLVTEGLRGQRAWADLVGMARPRRWTTSCPWSGSRASVRDSHRRFI